MLFVSEVGISTKKSANACDLMLALGLYSMSCSPNSMNHLVNLPDFSGFSKAWRMGWVVNTSMWYA